MILERITTPPLPAAVLLSHWRRVLERALERYTVIDWTLEMAHPESAMLLRQVAAEAGLVALNASGNRFECGPGTLDWLIARKLAEASR